MTPRKPNGCNTYSRSNANSFLFFFSYRFSHIKHPRGEKRSQRGGKKHKNLTENKRFSYVSKTKTTMKYIYQTRGYGTKQAFATPVGSMQISTTCKI